MTQPISEELEAGPLEEVLVAYLEAVERGEVVDRATWLARHPQLTTALEEYFADEELLLNCAGPTTAEQTRLCETAQLSAPAGDTSQPRTVEASDRAGSRPAPLPARFGRYEVGRRLGSGGMGEVYEAFDTVLKRQVALKVPRFSLDDDRDLLRRFQQEAIAAANLQHAHICPVFDVGQIDGRWYISMALIDGKCLSDPAVREQLREPQAAAAVVRTLAQTLAETHARGIVHRDLKPSNLMLDQRGAPVILDFGLALQFDSADRSRLTEDGVIVGTLSYMSPEQLEGASEVGPASDIYSLGVVLYELLTGRVPFTGSTRALASQILLKSPSPPSTVRAEIDPRLDDICLKMLAKRPADRLTSMTEVAAALTDLLDSPAGEQVVSRTAQPQSQSRRSHRWAWGLIALAVILLGGWFAAPWVLEVLTPHGKVRIVVHDPRVKVEFAGEEITVEHADKIHRVEPGPHALTIRHDGKTYETNSLELGKGDNPSVTVSLVKDSIEIKQGDKLVDSLPLPKTVPKPEPTPPIAVASVVPQPPAESPAEKARKLYAEAQKMQRTGNYRDAMPTLAEAIKLDPKFADAYLLRGKIIKRYWERGESDKRLAYESLDKAISLNPQSSEAFGERAELNKWIGEAKNDQKLLENAVRDYSSAIQLKDEWRWRFQRAWICGNLKRYDESDRDYRRVIEILRGKVKKLDDLSADERQNLAWAYLNNVNMLLAKGDVAAAVIHGEGAVEVAADMPAAVLNQAKAYAAHRDYEKAKQAYEKLRQLDPYNASAYRGLAGLYSELRDAQAEQLNLLLAMQVGSTNPYDALNYAEVSITRGYAEQAVAILDRVRTQLDKEPNYHLVRGEALGLLGDAKQHVAGIEAAAKAAPDDPYILLVQGEQHWQAGRRDEAWAIWNKVDTDLSERLEKEEHLPRRVLRASLRMDLHRFDEARADFEQIVSADPRNYRTQANLAEILAAHPDEARRDPAKAKQLAQRACELTGNEQPWALSIQAVAHAASGDFAQAIEWQKRALKRVANTSKREYLERLATYERHEPYVLEREMEDPRFGIDIRPQQVDPKEVDVAKFAALSPLAERGELSAKMIAAKYGDGVVLIKGEFEFGTGMILSADGYVLTCAHVLPYRGDPTVHYEIKGQAKEAPATVLYLDFRRDLALVKFTPVDGDLLTTVRLALDPKVEQGDSVTTLGNPGEAEFILKKSLLDGLVSSSAQNVGLFVPRNLIQTSVPITGGFSGGPLFNRHGEVVGVNVSRAQTASASFAIPTSDVLEFLGQRAPDER